jgi:hypothetical protein
MNRNFLFLLSGMLFVCLPVARTAESTPASAFATRAKQTRERLEILFRHRDEAPVSSNPSQNPFRTPNDASATTDENTTQPTESPKTIAPTSEEALLKAAVATLKISGTVVVSDQINVSINQETYREGSVITARVQGIPVYLRIRRITNNGVTFVLNQLELVQPF